jgi:NAD(P)-dependent dehydrogenase (short-subunit alcohol dehydrogenase family)
MVFLRMVTGDKTGCACGKFRSENLLENKTVVVIGGSSGMGLAVAENASRSGARVVIASRSQDKLAAAAGRIGGDVHWQVVDTTDETSVADLFERLGCRRSPGDSRQFGENRQPAGDAPGRWPVHHAEQVLGTLPVRQIRPDQSRRVDHSSFPAF